MHEFLTNLSSNLKHSILGNSFTRKLTFAFLAAVMIPIILISMLFYRINMSNSYDKVSNATYLANRQLVQQIESRFFQMEKVADTIQSYMYSYPKKEETISTEQLNAFYTLRTNIQALTSAFDFTNICIFLGDGFIFNNEGLMFYPLDRMNDFGFSVEKLLAAPLDSTWLYIQDQTYPFMLSYISDREFAPINAVNCLRVQPSGPDRSLDYAFSISINASEFTALLDSSYDNTEVTGHLFDPEFHIVASSGSEEVQEHIVDYLQSEKNETEEDHSVSVSRRDAIYYVNELSNGWIYVTYVPQTYIRSDAFTYVRSIIAALALVLPFAAIAVILLTRNFTRRITLLSNAASQVSFDQNQFNVSKVDYVNEIEQRDYDDVDRLAVTYNNMLDMLQENIEHITALRIQEESLKYRLLQSLINPHFLYNILDSVMVCNTVGKSDVANRLLMNLSKFYRMTLRKSNELITIRDELEIVRLYLEMESTIRGGNLRWDIEMDEGIENFMICKFTLQPFIENSILHGMQGSSQVLHIQIDIRYGEDTILIFIRDNGHGIPPEKLEELRDSLRNHMIDTSKHFGICNVNARISSELFGHGFIEIDSEYQNGTTVKIEFQQILL